MPLSTFTYAGDPAGAGIFGAAPKPPFPGPIPARTARRETRALIIERASGDSGDFLAMCMGSFFSGTRDGCAGLIM